MSPRGRSRTWTADGLDPLVVALREARIARGLSVRVLAATLGVSGPSISGWEWGEKHPSLPTLRRWAAAVGVTLEHRTVADD